MSSKSQIRPEVKSIATVVRALVTSKKPPCYLVDILREYRDVEGETLPFYRLGFRNAEELLEFSNEFIVRRFGGNVTISAKFSAKSSHIASLVSGQRKSSSTRINTAPVPTKKASFNQFYARNYAAPPFKKFTPFHNNNNNRTDILERENATLRQQNVELQELRASMRELMQKYHAVCQQKELSDASLKKQIDLQIQAQEERMREELVARMREQQSKYNLLQEQQEIRFRSQLLAYEKLRKEFAAKLKHEWQQEQISASKSAQAEAAKSLNNNNNENLQPPTIAMATLGLLPQQATLQNRRVQDRLIVVSKEREATPEPSISSNLLQGTIQDRLTAGSKREHLQNAVPKESSSVRQVQPVRVGSRPIESLPQPRAQRKSVQCRLNVATQVDVDDEESPLKQEWQQKRISAPEPAHVEAAKSLNNNNENLQPLLGRPPTKAMATLGLLPQQATLQNRRVQDHLIVVSKEREAAPEPSISPNPLQRTIQNRLTAGSKREHLRNPVPKESISVRQVQPVRSGSRPLGSLSKPRAQRKSVQYRLNVSKQVDVDDEESPPPVAIMEDEAYNDIEEPFEMETPDFADPVQALKEFCISRGYVEPTFEYFKMAPNFNRVQCQIMVNGSIHSTYPDDFPTRVDAKVGTAKIILTRLLRLEARRKLPPCNDYEDELLDKLYSEIKRHPHGMFASKVPDWFERKFKQLIPEHWWALVHVSSQFITESTADDNIILFATPNMSLANESLEPSFVLTLNGPELPWSASEWTVCITRCVSTMEIWGRLADPASVTAFDKFSACLEQEMLRQTSKPLYVSPNQLYVAKMADCWHRVRVDEQNNEREEALCFLVDSGELTWISNADLYRCPLVYLEFAKQALKFQLRGLKELAHCEQASEVLRQNLPDLTLTARVYSNQELYLEEDIIEVELLDKAQNAPMVSVLDLIQQHLHAPKLGENSLKKVKISHISHTGHLYLQIPDEMLVVEELIAKEVQLPDPSPTALELGKLYLIFDETYSAASKWYRGTIADDCLDESAKMLDIFYVDCGVTRKVATKCIYDLETFNKTLTIIPHQAIKCLMHEVPPITPHIVGRLRALLPDNCEALVKQNALAEVPQITVYNRVLETDFLSNINDIIRVEDELQAADMSPTALGL